MIIKNIDPAPVERKGPIVVNHEPVVLNASVGFSARALERQEWAAAVRNVGTIGPVDSDQTSKITALTRNPVQPK